MTERQLAQKPKFYTSVGFIPRVDQVAGFSNPTVQIAPISEYLNSGKTVFRNLYKKIPLLIGIGRDTSTSIYLFGLFAYVTTQSSKKGKLIKRKSANITDDPGLVADNAQIVSVVDLDFIANIKPYARN